MIIVKNVFTDRFLLYQTFLFLSINYALSSFIQIRKTTAIQVLH